SAPTSPGAGAAVSWPANSRLACGTGLRRPLTCGRVGQLLVVRAADEWSGQVLRIFDDVRDDQPRIAVGFGGSGEVFSQHRVRAVRHAVLLQIAGLHA